MSVRLVCTCGKGFKVLNSRPGQRFKCTQCSEVVTVPRDKPDPLEDFEEVEDVGDYEASPFDDIDEAEMEAPVVSSRQLKNSSKRKKRARNGRGSGRGIQISALHIAGQLVGWLGMAIGGLYLFLGALQLGTMQPLGGILFWVFGLLTIMGARACRGQGLQVSRDAPWMGDRSIIAGFL
jgi:hypothetical protein